MKKVSISLSLLMLILSPIICQSETIANCTSRIAHSFYPNIGLMHDEKSGWKEEKTEYKITLVRKSDNTFDILFTDATNQIQSSSDEGADVSLLRSSANEIVIFVIDPGHQTSIEIYEFIRDKDNHNILTITTNEGYGDVSNSKDISIYKSSIEVGDCAFINFLKSKN